MVVMLLKYFLLYFVQAGLANSATFQVDWNPVGVARINFYLEVKIGDVILLFCTRGSGNPVLQVDRSQFETCDVEESRTAPIDRGNCNNILRIKIDASPSSQRLSFRSGQVYYFASFGSGKGLFECNKGLRLAVSVGGAETPTPIPTISTSPANATTVVTAISRIAVFGSVVPPRLLISVICILISLTLVVAYIIGFIAVNRCRSLLHTKKKEVATKP